MFQFFVMLGTSFVVVQIIMLLFWGLYLVQRNVSVVDIGWCVAFIGAAIVDFILGDGYIWRKILVLIVVSIWALRLALYLAHRYLPEKDDPRYQLLLQRWPFAGHPLFQAYSLFAVQGVLVTILSMTFALMCQNALPYFSAFEVFGLLLWMAGVAGETVADRQLEQFKNDPARTGQVCDSGLWAYSRHPNYFFEWVVWLGFFVMALSSPFGWLSIIAPIIMLVLLLKVSGVPFAEARALETKGEAYRDYQDRTSVFFPWFSHRKHNEPKDPPQN